MARPAVDSFAVVESATNTIVFDPGADQFNAAGTVTLAGADRPLRRHGSQSTWSRASAAERVINGTCFGDTIYIEDADPSLPGLMRVRFDGLGFYDAPPARPRHQHRRSSTRRASLTVKGGLGADTITVNSLDAAWAAELYIYGNHGDRPTLLPGPLHRQGRLRGLDQHPRRLPRGVRRDDQASTPASRSTRATATSSSAPAGSHGRARERAPAASGASKDVSIDIGANATLKASSIYLIAQAEDRSFADARSARTGITSTFVIAPAARQGRRPHGAADQGPGQVRASATVTIRDGARLIAAASDGLDPSVGVSASTPRRSPTRAASPSSSLFSVGYALASATATIDVGERVRDQRRRVDQPHLGRDRDRRHHDRDRARSGHAEGRTRSSRSRSRWRSATRS